MEIPVIIPAAGKGTRLRPLTEDKPKALIEVGRKPLLSHCFEVVPEQYVSKYVVVTGYKGNQIKAHYSDEYRDTQIVYTEQNELLGLADAVLTTESNVNGPFLVINGDNVLQGDLTNLIQSHVQSESVATLLVEEVSREIAKTRGVVIFDENDEMAGYVEKPDDPPSTRASAGVFAFEPVIFDACRVITPSDRGEYELTDAIDLLLYAGHSVRQVLFSGSRINVNTEEDIGRANRILKETED